MITTSALPESIGLQELGIRRRLDAELVRRGLATSRGQAHELIGAGRVTVGGAPALKPGRLVGPDEPLVVAGEPARFVSRGGEKLQAALERFTIPTTGQRALDAGASTGGFTDCLLQQGVREVVAVDVGYGQLHERLRDDPRVDVRERTNIRYVEPGDLGDPFDIAVADLSFISLRLVIPTLLSQVHADGHLVLLIKPQFEAGRAEASRGRGVIRDPQVWSDVLRQISDAICEQRAGIIEAMVSPLPGADGNIEFLVHVRPGAATTLDTQTLVDEAQHLRQAN